MIARAHAAALLLALALPGAAFAGSMKKLSDGDLQGIAQSDPDPGRRIEAIELLGDRHSTTSVAVLGTLLRADEDRDVVEHALAALEDIGTAEARQWVARALLDRDMYGPLRLKAAKILGKQDPGILTEAAPVILGDYRTLDDGLAVRAIEALPAHRDPAAYDYTILIATDPAASRKVRVAAFDAAEAVNHPALYQAYLSLLSDTDKRVRIRCVEGLGKSGYPASAVVPALQQVARNDDDGPVRTAAFKSLKNYATPELLPLLHYAVLNERAPMAWWHAMELMQSLADRTSVPVIAQLLGMQENLNDDQVISLVHTLIRIGDPSAVPSLEALARATASEKVRIEAVAAADLLRGPEAQRVTVIDTWTPLEVVYVDITAPAPPPPVLSVSVDASGGVAWGAGVSFSTSVALPSVTVVDPVGTTVSLNAAIPAATVVVTEPVPTQQVVVVQQQPAAPLYVAAEPTPVVTSSSDFAAILRAVDAESFSDGKMGVLRSASGGRWFTVQQVKELMGHFSFSSDQVDAAAMLYPQVYDPQNWFQVYDALTFSSDKDELRSRTR